MNALLILPVLRLDRPCMRSWWGFPSSICFPSTPSESANLVAIRFASSPRRKVDPDWRLNILIRKDMQPHSVEGMVIFLMTTLQVVFAHWPALLALVVIYLQARKNRKQQLELCYFRRLFGQLEREHRVFDLGRSVGQ